MRVVRSMVSEWVGECEVGCSSTGLTYNMMSRSSWEIQVGAHSRHWWSTTGQPPHHNKRTCEMPMSNKRHCRPTVHTRGAPLREISVPHSDFSSSATSSGDMSQSGSI